MAGSEFRKGAAVGAVSVVVFGWVVVALAAWAFALTSDDEPPEPTADRVDTFGTVTSTDPMLCVVRPPTDDAPRPAPWCGFAQPGSPASFVAVGDAVTGTIVGVETDPKSGWAFAVWESVTTT